VLNKSENLSECDLVKMRYCIADLMRDSKLVYKNSIRNLSASSQLIQNRKRTARTKHSDSEAVNFIVIPKVDKRKEGSGEFIGMPSLERSVKHFTREILSIKRAQSQSSNSATHSVATLQTGFTERKWLAYANKVWDSIRKSSLMNEYNRLMT